MIMMTFESICLGIPEILLPRADNDFAKWAVIACDQYTSEPEYWHRVNEIVGNAPSTLNLIYPEVYLQEDNPEGRIENIHRHMTRYLNDGLLEASEGLVYVERQTGDGVRKGLLACLDLEAYDFRPGSTSFIRATEGTILDRIPPRVRIRKGAPLELPHILVLIDDPEDQVIGPIAASRDRLPKLYDFELMMGSGRLTGFRASGPDIESGVFQGLRRLADPGAFAARYGLPGGTPVLLYAMGDGNHSFATAKTIWEATKERASDRDKVMDSPLRFALVELVNLRDDALVFEPIHRILFNGTPETYFLEDMKEFYGERFSFVSSTSFEEMKDSVDAREEGRHRVGIINAGGFGVIEIEKPDSNLAVGTLQNFLDVFLKSSTASLDYVHGTNSVKHLGMKPGNTAFYLPAMDKNQLFRTVILDGALPRKTFSMGEAWEKRFYMEARKLV